MSKTLDGLMQAFVGECQARNRYTFYASIARKEGFERIATIFSLTADNEKEHANWFYKMMKEVSENEKIDINKLIIETPVPFMLSVTADNVDASIVGETYEYTEMYPEISAQALKDGYPKIAARVRAIANAEKHHAERYGKILANLKGETVFKKEENVYWVCRECGYLHFGKMAPKECPSCGHAQSFFEVNCEQF